jgi:hypothetical protein
MSKQQKVFKLSLARVWEVSKQFHDSNAGPLFAVKWLETGKTRDSLIRRIIVAPVDVKLVCRLCFDIHPGKQSEH